MRGDWSQHAVVVSHVSQNRRDVGHPVVVAMHADVVEGHAAGVTLSTASKRRADVRSLRELTLSEG